jgi:hypothetical protein
VALQHTEPASSHLSLTILLSLLILVESTGHEADGALVAIVILLH